VETPTVVQAGGLAGLPLLGIPPVEPVGVGIVSANTNFGATSLLGNFKQMMFANVACGSHVTGAVLTVPPFFGESGNLGGFQAETGFIALTDNNCYAIDMQAQQNSNIIVVQGELVFPGFNGLNMIRVFQPTTDLLG
jgi:hypothetical protein